MERHTQTNLHWIRSALNPRLSGQKSSTLTETGIWIESSILQHVAVRQLATCWPTLARVPSEVFLHSVICVFRNFLTLSEACHVTFCWHVDCNRLYFEILSITLISHFSQVHKWKYLTWTLRWIEATELFNHTSWSLSHTELCSKSWREKKKCSSPSQGFCKDTKKILQQFLGGAINYSQIFAFHVGGGLET